MSAGGNLARRVCAVAMLALLGAGCASSPTGNDPFEPMNRGFHNINTGLDDLVLRPVAEKYAEHTPEPVRDSISNFFDNVAYPGVILNDFLQGKFKQGFADIGRFVVNSTLGVLGLLDPASTMGLRENDEDFGQTLGVWGLEEVAYLELPFFGPSSVRDAPDIPVSTYANLLFYIGEAAVTAPLAILSIVDTRSQLLTATRVRDESALDPYIFTREAYRQRRTYLIHDGDPPLEEFGEFDDLEPAEETY